jgi:hypothetical protein
MRKRFFVNLLIAATCWQLDAGDARADTKACVAAHASAQRETKTGHLREAARLYTSCGSDLACPEQLRSECGELLDGVRRIIPSVIFSVIDKTGADTTTVKIYSGDTLISDGIDGRAVELDPGKYQLRFVLQDGSTLTSDVVVREGEKNRLVQVKAEPELKPEPAPIAPPATMAPAPPPPAVAKSSPPLAAWVATGVAVVGLGTFGTFALLGSNDKSKLDDCAPSCPESERSRRDDLKTKFLVADIGLGVGAASAVLATILFVGSGSREEPAAARRQRPLDVATDRHGARVTWRGEF